MGANDLMDDQRETTAPLPLASAAMALANGRGHKAQAAAREIIEDAARLDAISIIGEQENKGTWAPSTITTQDCLDLIFVWPTTGEEVAAEPVRLGLGLLPYRKLTMPESDVRKLAQVFDEWLATSKDGRTNLAYLWWARPARNALQSPPEAERFPLPLWAADFELVRCIARHQEIPPGDALTLLGNAIKEIIRTRVMAEDDRSFLASVVLMPRNDATLIRIKRLVRAILSAELDGPPDARLRVLLLFDPDLADHSPGPTDEIARAAISAAETIVPLPDAVTPRVSAAHGRGRSGPKPPAGRDDVIRQRLLRGEEPGRTVSWGKFCDAVRDDAVGWINKHMGTPARGFNERAIKTAVKGIRTSPSQGG
jgi:hypothetical protein